MAGAHYGNELERLARQIGDDPIVRTIRTSVVRNPWFLDSGIRLLQEHARKKGLDPTCTEPFYRYLNPEDVSGPIAIAKEKYHGLTVGLSEKELGEGVFAGGRSGAYKTSLFETICPQWVNLGNTVFIISQKRDYLGLADVLPHCCVMGLLKDFKFNPLQAHSAERANLHAQSVANAARKNFGSLQSGEITLYRAIDELYRAFGVYEGRTDEFPTFGDVLDYTKSQYARPYSEEFKAKERLEKRVDWVCRSLGPVINVSKGIPIESMLSNNIILLIDGVTPEIRDFLTECVLLSMFTYRIEKGERL